MRRAITRIYRMALSSFRRCSTMKPANEGVMHLSNVSIPPEVLSPTGSRVDFRRVLPGLLVIVLSGRGFPVFVVVNLGGAYLDHVLLHVFVEPTARAAMGPFLSSTTSGRGCAARPSSILGLLAPYSDESFLLRLRALARQGLFDGVDE